MAHFFISDVHLRLDRPDRAERLSRFVDRLASDDTLTICGDLCDFWFVSRQSHRSDECRGLEALGEFRHRGGELRLIAGNHDRWLSPIYADRLALEIRSEPLELTVHGTRVHVVHGHRVKSGIPWKRFLETRPFLAVFSRLPNSIASKFDWFLENENQKSLARRHRRFKRVYRRYVQERLPGADVFVFGHVHERVDERIGSARLVILGNWNSSASYLRIDERGASFEEDR